MNKKRHCRPGCLAWLLWEFQGSGIVSSLTWESRNLTQPAVTDYNTTRIWIRYFCWCSFYGWGSQQDVTITIKATNPWWEKMFFCVHASNEQVEVGAVLKPYRDGEGKHPVTKPFGTQTGRSRNMGYTCYNIVIPSKNEGVGLEVVNQADLGGKKTIVWQRSFWKEKNHSGPAGKLRVSTPAMLRVGGELGRWRSRHSKIRVTKRSIPTGAQAHTIYIYSYKWS